MAVGFWDIQTISNIIGVKNNYSAADDLGDQIQGIGAGGYAMGVATFLIALSFMFTTPGMIRTVDGLSLPTGSFERYYSAGRVFDAY